ncbi:retrovirus-related Pol polyprotein from type-2 retrotransposable element R2DM, partial [Trichonephila clavipes]
YCRHCDKKIFLTSTLEDHYRRKHSRSLSPQGKPLSKVKPEPMKKTGSNCPMAVQPSTSKWAQGLEPIPPLLKSIPHGSMDETAKIPPPARSTAANKVRTGGNPPLPNVLVPVATEDTLPSPDPVPAHTAKTERRNEKKFICDFCERRFATAGALEDHARCVHEVAPEITFAFEDDGEPADFTPKSAARTHQRQLMVNYSCKRCSASTPTSFLSKERLDKHMAQCHAQPSESAEPSARPTTPSEKAIWCPHCARYIHPRQTLVQHIRAVHNESFTAKERGLAHTKVVRFAADDVVDAAACSDVPAYHVLCPDGLRPDAATRDQPAQMVDGQQAGPSRVPDPPQPAGHGVTPIANVQPINTDALCCEVCRKVAKTHKALKYHQLRMHGIPVLKPHALRSNNKPEEKPVKDDQQEPVPPPPSPDALPLITSQAVTTAAAAPGAALLGETLRFTFPLPRVVACPIHNCGHTFCTKSWYTTTNSAKKHLRMYHRLFNRTTQYWCSVCDRNITTKPFSHPCLKATGMMLKKVGQNAWPCEECGESFTTKIGLNNHAKVHKRNEVADRMVQLDIPEGPQTRKARRQGRLRPLSEGDPGDMSLAPRHDDPPLPDSVQENTIDNENQTEGRISVKMPSILTSFVEPLDTLLSVDEISDSRSHFEAIVAGITVAMQEHFHLTQDKDHEPKKTGSKQKSIDLQNPQQVQRTYKWNRRKCIRAITQKDSARCPVSREDTHQFFTRIWESTRTPIEQQRPDPPSRPPICEAFTTIFVESCLKSAENSAPGPDRLTYRHWREVDPYCKVITKIFNICLKMSDIPSAWKTSSTVLIHKKDDPAKLENWRPISLSSTLYKLFTKCLTRKLGDWCQLLEVLSPAQKGFTPHDGRIRAQLSSTRTPCTQRGD